MEQYLTARSAANNVGTVIDPSASEDSGEDGEDSAATEKTCTFGWVYYSWANGIGIAPKLDPEG